MKILVRYGELMLKGKNRKNFINKVNNHVKNKFSKDEVKISFLYDNLTIIFNEELKDEIINKLKTIPGLHSYSVIYEATHDLDNIVLVSIDALNKELINNKSYQFKLETKRSNKNFPITSPELTKKLAPLILNQSKNDLIVNVREPEVILNIDVRTNNTIIYLTKELLMGGFPSTIAGKGLLMMSGGIDSPVAAFLAIKQGVEVELLHFESTPLTPLESLNKVIDLSAKLANFMPREKIKLHIVPFFKIHEALLNNVSDSYIITIMRRMMYRVSEAYANNYNIDIIINGESLGQVASQTLKSMKAVENVTNIPIIRPLVTYDKSDIIKIAKNIDTYNISIKPFNDCCSIYVPKQPVINPEISICEFEESKYDYNDLIKDTISNIRTITVSKDLKLDLSAYGFTFMDAYNEWKNSND